MVLSRPRRPVAVVAVVAVLCVLFAAPAAADTQWVLWTNGKTGQCFGVSGGVMANGTKVIQWPCNESNPDQLWSRIPAGGGYALKNRKNPAKCLAAPNNSATRGVQLIIWDCNGGTGQQWEVKQVNPTDTMIRNWHTHLVVAVSGGSQTPGAAVIQWTWSATYEQVWRGHVYADV